MKELTELSNDELLDELANFAIQSDDCSVDLSSSGRRFGSPILARKKEIFSRRKEGDNEDYPEPLNQMLGDFMDLAIEDHRKRDDTSRSSCHAIKQQILEMLFEPELQTAIS